MLFRSKAFEVLAQGKLSIVSVGGDDNEVDNGEFAKPIEIVLKAENIKGIQAGHKILIAVGGKTAEVMAEGAPDSQTGLFKASLGPDQAHGASNSLGLSMGKSYSMTASMKVADVDYNTTGEKSFEVLPQDQTSDPLKIISVAGDNILDEKEYQHGFEIVYKVNDPSYNSKDDEVRVKINGNDFKLMPTQITLDSEGNYVGKIENYQLRNNNIKFKCGDEVNVEVDIKTNSNNLTAESKLMAHAPQVAIVSIGGTDNKIDNKEFENPIEIVLQKNGWAVDEEKVSLTINGKDFELTAKNNSVYESVVHFDPKEAGLTQGNTYTIKTKTNGVVSEEYPFEVLSGPFGRDVGNGSGKSTLFYKNNFVVYPHDKYSDYPTEWIFYDLKKLGGLPQDGKIVFKVNGTEVGSLDVKAGVNDQKGQFDETISQRIINALKEDQVSLILAEYMDSQGNPIKTLDARPALLNAKPGENRTLLESTNKDGHLKDDLVTIDDISAIEIERQYRRTGTVKFHGNAKDLIDSNGNGCVSDIVVVIGGAAYRPKPNNGKWEIDLNYKELVSTGVDVKKFGDNTWHLYPETSGLNIPIQVFAIDSEGKTLGYAQNSIFKDTQPKIILDPISGNNILTNSEIDGTIELTGRIKNGAGLEYHIYMDGYDPNGGEILGEGYNRARRVYYDDEEIRVRIDPKNIQKVKNFNEGHFYIELNDPNSMGYSYSTHTMKFNDKLILDYMKNERGVTDHNEIDKLVSATHGDNSRDVYWGRGYFYEQDGYSILDVPKFPNDGDPKFDSIEHVQMSYPNIKNVVNSLSVINSIRQMNGLDPVKLSRDFQTIEQTQKAVISMANEGKISHDIAGDNFKYTDQDAIAGAKNSLLGKTTQIDVVMGYVSDENSVVRTTGSTAADKMNIDHRIALLNPNLKELAPAFAAGQDGFIYSGFGLKYDQPAGGASKQPETLEWPPAGVSWYSMVPNTAWSFHCNAEQFHLRKVTVYRARDGQNPEKLEVDQAVLQEVGKDSPYKRVLTFNPHEMDRRYDEAQRMWIDKQDNTKKHRKGIDQVYDTKHETFTEYTVIIDTEEKVYTYTSTVRYSSEPSPYPGTWNLGQLKLTEDQVREMMSAQNTQSQYLGKSEIEKELMDELREHSESLRDVSNAREKAVAESSQSHENTAVAGALNQEVHAKPEHIDPLVVSDNHHPTHFLSPINSSVDLGNGDDEITVAKISGGSIDGGRGFDTIHFAQGGNELNLINFANVEVIDLGYFENDSSFNALTITAEGMKQNGGSIELKGNAGHKIVLKEGVIESDQTSIDDFGGIRHELQYNVNGNQFRIVMNDDLYNGGASIL